MCNLDNRVAVLLIQRIGLPYAMSQAGFFLGIVLLVVLCGVTDWTIRLVVINAKLSGRNSYIEIMNNCFGPSGRAAVSLFQFAFAFGGRSVARDRYIYLISTVKGMCAFGIIIGQSFPHSPLQLPTSARRGYNTPCHSFAIPNTIQDTRPILIHQPTIHHSTLHYMCIVSALPSPRYSQTLPSIWPGACRHVDNRRFRSGRRPARGPRTKRRSLETAYFRWPRRIPGDRCHQLRIRLPPQLPSHIW